MKIYLAAQYNRAAEMREVRALLCRRGHEVTSHWIDLDHETEGTPRYAQEDFYDVAAADAVVSFTSANGGGHGGRHVEFGIGLALNKRLIIVGPRENIFHALPQVEVYPDLMALISRISPPSP